ncbi:enhanced intracellular survival protein Eis [Bacillus salitolerans]|uniref:Enhanced intracellular survival protein Eis n=1 Tax=Bacillus salitolerans TaxID=1437434 RepID=A0ABW4LW22_9BACI
MSEIRKLSLEELETYSDIVINAYPGVSNNSPDYREKLITRLTSIQEEDETIDFYGLFREDKLLGGMRIHTFTMNVLQHTIPTGGVGLVAVDLLHKKEKVAKEMIEGFIEMFKDKNVPLVMLYPFRPDFYKKMGFGYGSKMNQYRMNPSGLPKHAKKDHLQFAREEDGPLLVDCFNRYAKDTHGMIYKNGHEAKNYFQDPNKKIVVYKKDNVIEGYLSFSFKKMSETNFCLNDLVIHEFVYETNSAFMELCGFLESQADQVNRIVLNTQDEAFHHVLSDPRNHTNELIPSVYHESHTAGVGIMYRVIDVEQFFRIVPNHLFGYETVSIKLKIDDSFIQENSKDYLLKVTNGRIEVLKELTCDVTVGMDIADYSSLIMGAVDFQALYRFGKVQLSDESYISLLNQMFRTNQNPICMTLF